MGTILRPRQLVLIRHGESSRNRAKGGNVYFADDENRASVRGVPDHNIPLTELGISQAQQTGVTLCERFARPNYVYHSGYTRTIQTAEGLLDAFSPEDRAEIRVREHLLVRERDPGYAYDMTTAEAEAAFPWLAGYWKTFGGFMARPPGGESLADTTHRVHRFLGSLFRDRTGMSVWVVTHGGTIRCFRYLLEHWTYDQGLTFNGEPKPENCGVTVYNFDPDRDRLVLSEYNTVHWKP